MERGFPFSRNIPADAAGANRPGSWAPTKVREGPSSRSISAKVKKKTGGGKKLFALDVLLMISQKVIKKDSLLIVFAFSAYFMMNKLGSFFVGIFLVLWHESLQATCCENALLF